MEDCTPYDTPIPVNHKLNSDPDGKEVDCRIYCAMIGSLMYLTTSRPGIMFVVCICSRFQAKPKESHLIAVKGIYRYLKGKQRLGLGFPHGSNFEFNAYTDSDFGTISISTCEAEYIAAASCCSQILWIQQQLRDYGLNFTGTPMSIDKKLIELVKVHTNENFANLFTKAFDRTSWILLPESIDSHYISNSLESFDSESF
ncbi:hypothetical protein L1987_48549 [Smallanthus sonchifolius]|uniref:Uncharacterized protein n=1 Tax=Smallanthus sonchifolius TaxID=185202 RepID=A0ACB9FSA4_9ASTR|nr:hypothetical protein L1987_48549 [Smallanthus sonchifolius]